MQNFTEENPLLLREKGTAADNAGDYEKAALFYALADSLELMEEQADKIADMKKDLEERVDYSAYKDFFNNCFGRLNAHYPCPEVTSDYDCSVIFDAIEKGESQNAQN